MHYNLCPMPYALIPNPAGPGGGGAGGGVSAPAACVRDGGLLLPAVARPSAHQGEGHGAEEPGGHLPSRLHRGRGDGPLLSHRGGRALSTSGAPNRGCQGNRGGQQMEEPHLLRLQVGGYKPVPLGQERLGLPGPLHCSGELV